MLDKAIVQRPRMVIEATAAITWVGLEGSSQSQPGNFARSY